jgi:hypothetical protein
MDWRPSSNQLRNISDTRIFIVLNTIAETFGVYSESLYYIEYNFM